MIAPDAIRSIVVGSNPTVMLIVTRMPGQDGVTIAHDRNIVQPDGTDKILLSATEAQALIWAIQQFLGPADDGRPF